MVSKFKKQFFSFINNMVDFFQIVGKKIVYFFSNYLTRTELGFILLFCFYFILTDRSANSKVKKTARKTTAPNIVWRICGTLIYFPLLYVFFYPPFMFYAERTTGLNLTFNYYFNRSLDNLFVLIYLTERVTRNKFTFTTLYHFFFYYLGKLCIRFIPERIFHIPIYMRYHMMSVSLLSTLFAMVQELYINLCGIVRNSNYYTFATTKDESFVMQISLYFAICYIAILGNLIWQAARGQSFRNQKGLFDTFIQTHLSFDSLYKDEVWEDYGMDEVSLYFTDDESDEE